MSILVPLTVALGVAWILWRTFRAYILKSPLDNIPGPKRTSFIRGNIGDLFNRHGWDFHDRIATEFPAVARYHGPFGTRGLYVSDPKALHHIVVKDQDIYEEPAWFLSWNGMAFGLGLLSTIGEHHRKQRKLLNPVFSIAHMRDMTPLFYQVAHRLHDAVRRQVGSDVTEVNILNWMLRVALELIGQGGLGYSFDPLTHDAHNPYGDALKQFIPTTFTLHLYRLLYPYVRNVGSPEFRQFIVKLLPGAALKRLRFIIATSNSMSRQIYEDRKVAFEKGDQSVVQSIGEGKDILSILMKQNLQAVGEDKLPEEEVIAQMNTLVVAATDTTSNALSRTFQLLAEHQDVQEKLRAEINEASPDGQDIPYDDLVELPYLDAICRETLRLYTPVTMMSREVRRDVVLPFAAPITGVDGDVLNEIFVPKDTTVIIGIRACNRNKAIWGDDALEWKPERWLGGLPDTVGKAKVPGVYANLMTFLGGSRACIGFKFSQLEMKVVLAIMIRSFRFNLSDKEVIWNLAGVNYPTTGKDDLQPAMPLKLQALDGKPENHAV